MDSVLKFTGIAGLALTVLLIIFRGIVRKTIFPTLTKTHGYQIMRLIIILTFAIALAAFILYYFLQNPISAQKNPPGDVIIQGDHGVVAKEGGIVQMGEKRNAYMQEEIDTTFNDFIEDKMGDVVWINTSISVFRDVEPPFTPGYSDSIPEASKQWDSLREGDKFFNGPLAHLIDNISYRKFREDDEYEGGDITSLEFTVHDLDDSNPLSLSYYAEGISYHINVNNKNKGAISIAHYLDLIEIRGNFKVKNFPIAGSQGYREAYLEAVQ